jgi:hypothetical protein
MQRRPARARPERRQRERHRREENPKSAHRRQRFTDEEAVFEVVSEQFRRCDYRFCIGARKDHWVSAESAAQLDANRPDKHER